MRGSFPESLITLRMPCRMAAAIAVFKIVLALDVFGSQYFSLVVNWSSSCLASKMIWRLRVRVGSFFHSETKAKMYFSSLKIFSTKRRAIEKEVESKRVEDMSAYAARFLYHLP